MLKVIKAQKSLVLSFCILTISLLLIIFCQKSTRSPSSAPTYFDSPALQSLSPEILSIKPYSVRALYFARGYEDMALLIQDYLGEPRVLSSLDIEPHIVVEVSRYLKNLEEALVLIGKLKEAVAHPTSVKKADIKIIVEKIMVLLKDSEARASTFVFAKLALQKEITDLFYDKSHRPYNPRYVQRKILENIASVETKVKNLYDLTSSINMAIFSFMSNSNSSPIIKYFLELKARGNKFDGWVNFEHDENNLLREAFHSLYLASQEKNLIKKRELSQDFSLLLIVHEQWMIQPFYSKMSESQELIKGHLNAYDKVGLYKLSNKNWSNFQVRFGLSDNEDGPPTPSMIRAIAFTPGNIPDYYHSRIMDKKGLVLINAPEILKTISLTKFRQSYVTVNLDKSEAGATLYVQSGCVGCHQMDSLKSVALVGPDLSHVGSRLTREELFESIIKPNAVISKHCSNGPCMENIMPQSYSKILKKDQLEHLVDFLFEQK